MVAVPRPYVNPADPWGSIKSLFGILYTVLTEPIFTGALQSYYNLAVGKAALRGQVELMLN